MQNTFYITEFGATEGELSTESIQRAFDAASAAGGTVVIPKGTFVSGTINMGSASLYLEKGAVLKGSANPQDYRDNGYVHNEMIKTISLLYSMNHDDIHIGGEGTIDLNGHTFFDYNKRGVPETDRPLSEEQIAQCTVTYTFRPTQPMFFYQCNHVLLENITIKDAPNWTVSFHDCENLSVRNVTIQNDQVIPNNDGLHFCGCRDVRITGCNIVSGDDCIALSGITDWNKPCENFVISDCVLSSVSKAIVLGYMHSIVRNICINNCIIKDSQRGICIMTSTKTGLVENVMISNLLADTRVRAGNWWGNGEPICMFALYHHNEGYLNPAPDRVFPVNIRNIQMRNITCYGENMIGIIGQDGNVQDVLIDGIYYEKKKSANSWIKGENTIDVSPAAEKIAAGATEPVWLIVQGCEKVTVKYTQACGAWGREQTGELHEKMIDCKNTKIEKI